MSWKVLVTAPAVHQAGGPALEILRGAGCETVVSVRPGPLDPEELLGQLQGADAVLASVDRYSADVLTSAATARLKILSRWGVGYDAIDVAAATRQGVVVTNTPGVLDEAMADYTFALLLALARRVHEGHLNMRSGGWRQAWGVDVSGKTLGIIGYGRIGRAVARRAMAFNLRVLVHTRTVRPEMEQPGIRFVTLDELLAGSDFVSVHAALTAENSGMIGESQLRRMRRTAYLVNTARGALVEEAALLRALQEGWLAGAALDVYSVEPLPVEHPFRTTPNLLLTPHQGTSSRETAERIGAMAAQAIVDLMQGRRPAHVLNPEIFESPALRARLVSA